MSCGASVLAKAEGEEGAIVALHVRRKVLALACPTDASEVAIFVCFSLLLPLIFTSRRHLATDRLAAMGQVYVA